MSATSPTVRRADAADVPAILAMLADDDLTRARGYATLEVTDRHRAAFAAIDADPNQFLAIVEDGGVPLGSFQLTFIPGLSRGGALSALLEGVRVASAARGQGIGASMLAWIVEECRRRGCTDLQLTSDSSRTDARRFYERHGFVASHVGMKRTL